MHTTSIPFSPARRIALVLVTTWALLTGLSQTTEVADPAAPPAVSHHHEGEPSHAASRLTNQRIRQLRELMTFAVNDVHAYWSRTLGPQTAVRYRWLTPSETRVRTGCGVQSGVDAAFYCPADDTMYISYGLADLLDREIGDMAIVTVIAHEYGHNVQTEVRIPRPSRTARYELQADCLAGAYIADAYERGLADRDDLREAVAISLASGDSGPSDDPHGTGEQRVNALATGFHNGPSGC